MLWKIVSFGFKHGEPEPLPGAVVIDVRQIFRNPFHNPKLRNRTGLDRAVQADILQTPDFSAKYTHVKAAATTPGTEIAYIGCMGGRHRSVFLAEKLGRELGVLVEHWDLEKK